MHSSTMFGVASLLALAGAAVAQPGTGGTITDANATFVQGDAPTSAASTGPTADFFVGGPGNPDHLFQSWWWGRTVGVGTREDALANATSATWTGSRGRLDYSLASTGLQIIQTSRVVGFGSGGALLENLTVINTSAQALQLELFHYLDLDLGGTATGDSAVQSGPNHIRVTDGIWSADYEGSGRYEVGSFATVRALLTNTSIDNFSNNGLPFAAGDWTGGFQWTVNLAPGQATTIGASVTIVPAPAAGMVLAMGLLGRRRRRA